MPVLKEWNGAAWVPVGVGSTIQPTDLASKAPITTTTIDLVDRTNNTTETVPAGTTTNCSTAGVTKTAPALDNPVGTPPKRFSVKNLSAGNITVAYPDQAGAAQSLVVLPAETRTFRQKTTSGWGVESGAIAIATLDARFAALAGPFAPSSTGATAATRYVGGTTTGAPTSGTFSTGDWVTSQDGNVFICTAGGTPGTWVQAVGAGQILAGPFTLTSQVDVQAVGTTPTDVSGSTLVIPASSRGVLIRGLFNAQMNTGTATSGGILSIVVDLTDSSNNVLASGMFTALAGASSSKAWRGQITFEKMYTAPFAGLTVKCRYHSQAAVPANWTSAVVLPEFGGAGGENYLYAVGL